MKNKNLFIQYKIYFIGGGLLILIVAMVFLVVKPAFNKLNNDSDAVQKKALDMQIEKSKLSKLSELRQKFSIIESEQDKLDILFTDDKIVDLVQELEYVADKTNNDISIKIEELVKKKKNGQLKNTLEDDSLTNFKDEDYFEMEISLTGNYENLLRFIHKLDNMPYYNSLLKFNITVTEIDVKNDKKTIMPNNISINLFNGNKINNSSQDVPENKKKVLQSKLSVIFYLNK